MPKLLPRWRRRSGASDRHSVPALGAGTEHTRLRATVPGLFGREPLLRIDVDVETRQDTDGETVRIVAQIDGHLPAPPAPALSAPPSVPRSLRLAAQARVERAMERVAQNPAVRRGLERAAGHLRSQLVIEASTRPLAKGATALIPSGLARIGFGATRADDSPYPVIEAWQGPVSKRGGSSHVGVVQIAKRHLPPALVKSLGDKPFSLTAVIAHQLEPDD